MSLESTSAASDASGKDSYVRREGLRRLIRLR